MSKKKCGIFRWLPLDIFMLVFNTLVTTYGNHMSPSLVTLDQMSPAALTETLVMAPTGTAMADVSNNNNGNVVASLKAVITYPETSPIGEMSLRQPWNNNIGERGSTNRFGGGQSQSRPSATISLQLQDTGVAMTSSAYGVEPTPSFTTIQPNSGKGRVTDPVGLIKRILSEPSRYQASTTGISMLTEVTSALDKLGKQYGSNNFQNNEQNQRRSPGRSFETGYRHNRWDGTSGGNTENVGRSIVPPGLQIIGGIGTVQNPSMLRGAGQIGVGKSDTVGQRNMPLNYPNQKMYLNDNIVQFRERKQSIEKTGLDSYRALFRLETPTRTALTPMSYNDLLNTLQAVQTQTSTQNTQNNPVDKSRSVQHGMSKQIHHRQTANSSPEAPRSSFHTNINTLTVNTSIPTENRKQPEIYLDKVMLQSNDNKFSNFISQSSGQQVGLNSVPSNGIKKSELQLFNAKPTSPLTQQVHHLTATGDMITFDLEKLSRVDITTGNIQQAINPASGTIPPSIGQQEMQKSSLTGDIATTVETNPRNSAFGSQNRHFPSPSTFREQSQSASNWGSASLKNSTNFAPGQSNNNVFYSPGAPPLQQKIQRYNSAGIRVTFNVETSSGRRNINTNNNMFGSPISQQTQSPSKSEPRMDQHAVGLTSTHLEPVSVQQQQKQQQQKQQQQQTTSIRRYNPSGKAATFNVETSSPTNAWQSNPALTPITSTKGITLLDTNTFPRNSNSKSFESPISHHTQAPAKSQSRMGQYVVDLSSTNMVDSSGQQQQHKIKSIVRYNPSGNAITFNVETSSATNPHKVAPITGNEKLASVSETHLPMNSIPTTAIPSQLPNGRRASVLQHPVKQISPDIKGVPSTATNTQGVQTTPGDIPTQSQYSPPSIHDTTNGTVRQIEADNTRTKLASMLAEMAFKTLQTEGSHQHSMSNNIQNEAHQDPANTNLVDKMANLHTVLHNIMDELGNTGMAFKHKNKMVQSDKHVKAGNSDRILHGKTFHEPLRSRSIKSQQLNNPRLNTIQGTEIKQTPTQTSNLKSTWPIETFQQQTSPRQVRKKHMLDSSWLHPMTIQNIKAGRPQHQHHQQQRQQQQQQ